VCTADQNDHTGLDRFLARRSKMAGRHCARPGVRRSPLLGGRGLGLTLVNADVLMWGLVYGPDHGCVGCVERDPLDPGPEARRANLAGLMAGCFVPAFQREESMGVGPVPRLVPLGRCRVFDPGAAKADATTRSQAHQTVVIFPDIGVLGGGAGAHARAVARPTRTCVVTALMTVAPWETARCQTGVSPIPLRPCSVPAVRAWRAIPLRRRSA